MDDAEKTARGDKLISRRRLLQYGLAGVVGLTGGCSALTLRDGAASMRQIESASVESSTWKTHAVGRFLINLPINSQCKYTMKIWESIIEWRKDLTYKTAKNEAHEEITKYKNTIHKKIVGDVQFIDSFPIMNDGIIVHRWEVPHNKTISRMDCYFVSQDSKKRIFFNSLEVDGEHFKEARQEMEQLAHTLYAYDEWEPLPTEPGFIFEGGFSKHTGEWRAERAVVAFTLPSYPGIKGYFATYGLGTKQKFMFEEEGAAQRLAAIASKITVLRKGDVNLNGIPAQELCAAATEQGRRKYAFDLEAPGQGKDLGRPMLVLTLSSDEETSGNGFASDAEALGIWNAIRDTIRLRPGAI